MRYLCYGKYKKCLCYGDKMFILLGLSHMPPRTSTQKGNAFLNPLPLNGSGNKKDISIFISLIGSKGKYIDLLKYQSNLKTVLHGVANLISHLLLSWDCH